MKTSLRFFALFSVGSTLIFSSCEQTNLITPQPVQRHSIGLIDQTAPQVDYLLPSEGKVGTSVHVYGQRFSMTPSENQVWFGDYGVSTVKVISARELVVNVPDGATTGTLRIAVNGQSCTGSVFTIVPTN